MPYLPLYIAGALATLVVVSTAAFMALRTVDTGSTQTFSSGGGLFSWGEPSSVEKPTDTAFGGSGKQDLGVIPLPEDPLQSGRSGPDTFVSDLAELLLQLTQAQPVKNDSGDFVPSSYAYIPRGLVSAAAPAPRRSPDAQALFEYGNALGSTLQAFGDLHPNMPQILKDQAEDRANAGKAAALKRLADDFTKLGDDLALMEPPASAVATHAVLVAAYREVGDKLKRIPDAQGDEAFLAAIYSYNGAAENLSRRLVELVDLFASRNTQFSSSDAGSIFTFNANSSY